MGRLTFSTKSMLWCFSQNGTTLICHFRQIRTVFGGFLFSFLSFRYSIGSIFHMGNGQMGVLFCIKTMQTELCQMQVFVCVSLLHCICMCLSPLIPPPPPSPIPFPSWFLSRTPVRPLNPPLPWWRSERAGPVSAARTVFGECTVLCRFGMVLVKE